MPQRPHMANQIYDYKKHSKDYQTVIRPILTYATETRPDTTKKSHVKNPLEKKNKTISETNEMQDVNT